MIYLMMSYYIDINNFSLDNDSVFMLLIILSIRCLTFVIWPLYKGEKDNEIEQWVDEETMEEIYGKSGLEPERKRYKVVSS